MADDARKWNDISGKAQGAGIGGALGILTVVILSLVVALDAVAAGLIVGATSTIFSWLLPETPPWK